LKRIDSHQHFWKFDPVRDTWIDDKMKIIQNDFLPQDLQPILKENGFDGSVVVQSDQSEAENHFHLHNAQQFSLIKGVVGWIDFQSKEVEERLEYYSQFEKMKGFRHVLQGEPRRDLMLEPSFSHGISLLRKHNFTYDILVFEDQLQYIPEFVGGFRDQLFVIDHIAKPNIKDGKIEEWRRMIKRVGQFENIFCKLSGMVTEADWKNWKNEDFQPYMDVVVEAFGIDRILFGSDWPVCLVAGPYKKIVGIVEDYFSSFSKEEQGKFFGLNAMHFYNL
jgi:L-fuconolactonase